MLDDFPMKPQLCAPRLSPIQYVVYDPLSAKSLLIYFTNSPTTLPTTGAFVAAVKTAAGRDPTILGKPEKYMFEAITAIHSDIKPERTLMIGDRY